MNNIMDGKSLRDKLLNEYKEIIEKENLNIKLAIILVGNNDASAVYVRNKIKFCESVGITVDLHHLDENIEESELIKLIETLNSDEEITGIILQSPVPEHIDFNKCAELILPKKDIDGFTKENIYTLYLGNEKLIPCTVKGIIKLLEEYEVDLEGKNVAIIGRGEIVGKPLALALSNRNATVTLCHSKTNNLSDYTRMADIIISAVGKVNMVTEDMVKDGFIGIDVGINRDNGKLCGDFDYENIKDKAKLITPVPGGVGPMTIAMIIDNLIYTKRGEVK